jgi:hypothetical protein
MLACLSVHRAVGSADTQRAVMKKCPMRNVPNSIPDSWFTGLAGSAVCSPNMGGIKPTGVSLFLLGLEYLRNRNPQQRPTCHFPSTSMELIGTEDG